MSDLRIKVSFGCYPSDASDAGVACHSFRGASWLPFLPLPLNNWGSSKKAQIWRMNNHAPDFIGIQMERWQGSHPVAKKEHIMMWPALQHVIQDVSQSRHRANHAEGWWLERLAQTPIQVPSLLTLACGSLGHL